MYDKLKDLFDYEGCVMPTLVENNMTNKPMRLKSLLKISFYVLTLIKLTNLQISHKGKTNTHSQSQELYLFIIYELHVVLNYLN